MRTCALSDKSPLVPEFFAGLPHLILANCLSVLHGPENISWVSVDQCAHLNRELRFCITLYETVCYVATNASVNKTERTAQRAVEFHSGFLCGRKPAKRADSDSREGEIPGLFLHGYCGISRSDTVGQPQSAVNLPRICPRERPRNLGHPKVSQHSCGVERGWPTVSVRFSPQ